MLHVLVAVELRGMGCGLGWWNSGLNPTLPLSPAFWAKSFCKNHGTQMTSLYNWENRLCVMSTSKDVSMLMCKFLPLSLQFTFFFVRGLLFSLENSHFIHTLYVTKDCPQSQLWGWIEGISVCNVQVLYVHNSSDLVTFWGRGHNSSQVSKSQWNAIRNLCMNIYW